MNTAIIEKDYTGWQWEYTYAKYITLKVSIVRH